MGCLFAPLTTEALRRVRPEFTGVLAGLLNTSRQLGSSIGSAVTGGVLATLLASDMRARAVTAASGLPEPARSPFLGGFTSLGQTGLSVGRGQSGGAVVPASVPELLRTQLQHLIHTIFTGSYIDAMRATLVIPVALLLLCAISCALLIRPPRPATVPADPQPSQAAHTRKTARHDLPARRSSQNPAIRGSPRLRPRPPR